MMVYSGLSKGRAMALDVSLHRLPYTEQRLAMESDVVVAEQPVKGSRRKMRSSY